MAMSGFTIAGIVRRWARESPSAPAVTHGEETTSWGDLYERSARVAAGLAAAGVGDDDRVAFLDKNGPAYFEVLFGGAMVNAVNVAVNWRLAAAEVAAIVNDAGATTLFVGAEYLQVLDAIEPELTTVKLVVVVGAGHDRHPAYEDWVQAQDPADPGVEAGPGDVAMQLYTSGTTGLPKGVMLTNANIAGFMACGSTLDLDAESSVLVAMPLFHIGGTGWALMGMCVGAHSVVMREFDVDAVLDIVPRRHITHALLVPAMMLALTQRSGVRDVDFSRLRAIVYGASPISEALLATCMEVFGCDFHQWYGSTETTGTVTRLTPADHLDVEHRERLRSAGAPTGDAEVRVVDPATGTDAAPGAVGEIWVRSAQIMKGYWQNEAATAAAIDADGWFKTGDAGYLRDGYLYLYDRVKDMVVSGGENIYPAEVENALMKHSAIADVAVIGVPSERWGEEVKALVVRAPGHGTNADDVMCFARGLLAAYKVPKTVEFVDELPRNPSGKILKKELRAPYWEGRERRIG